MLSKKVNQAIVFLFVLGLGFSTISCSSKKSMDIAEIGSELKSEFGENGHYTSINATFDESVGSIINATVSEDPKSFKMEEWTSLRGAWEQKSEVTLTVDKGSPEEFKFNLNKDISFEKIEAIAESAKQQIIKEKKIEDVVVKSISIIAPDDDTKAATQIMLTIEPSGGGTSFIFTYDMAGNFKSLNY